MLTKAVLKREEKERVKLLFGRPVAQKEIHFSYGQKEKHVLFKPGEIFALEIWEANEYGTIDWKIYILKTVAPGEKVNRLPMVFPGAEILLTASGSQKVAKVKNWLAAIASQGKDLTQLSADYYQASASKVRVNLEPRNLNRPHGKVLTFLKRVASKGG